jgi:hypothetical protein
VLQHFRARHICGSVWQIFVAWRIQETGAIPHCPGEGNIPEAVDSSQAMQRRFGVPQGRQAREEQQLIVLAMGKLGRVS